MANINRQAVIRVGALVLVALVAAGLIISVILFVKNRGEQARRDEAIKIANEQAAEEDTPAPTDESTSEGTVNPDETQEETATESDDEPVIADADELPATGAGDAVLQLVAVSMLALSISFYVSSRRAYAQIR